MIVAGYDITVARKPFNPNAGSRQLSATARLAQAHKAAAEAAEALLKSHSR